MSQCTAKLSFLPRLEIGSKDGSGYSSIIKPALVALLDQPGMKRGTVASTLVYLRNVADRKGISFYTHTAFGLSQQTRKDFIMSLRTHGAQANERAHFSTTRTLSDFSLLIGVMLVGEYGGTSPKQNS
jgi:hypothetical protein